MPQTFGLGPEFNVRIRYRMRYERGFGLSFESQQLDVRVEPPAYTGVDSTIAPTKLSAILSGVEFYQMFGTRTKTTRMIDDRRRSGTDERLSSTTARPS